MTYMLHTEESRVYPSHTINLCYGNSAVLLMQFSGLSKSLIMTSQVKGVLLWVTWGLKEVTGQYCFNCFNVPETCIFQFTLFWHNSCNFRSNLILKNSACVNILTFSMSVQEFTRPRVAGDILQTLPLITNEELMIFLKNLLSAATAKRLEVVTMFDSFHVYPRM